MENESPIYFFTASILKFQRLLSDDNFKDIIIQSLQHLVKSNRLKVYAFVVMPNHLHFIWEEIFQPDYKESAKAAFMKFTAHQFQKRLNLDSHETLANYYVNKSDRKHQFWQEDPLSVEIYSRSVMEQKLDYIHNNPAQDHWNLLEDPIQYKYSSARYYEEEIDEFGIITHYHEVF